MYTLPHQKVQFIHHFHDIENRDKSNELPPINKWIESAKEQAQKEPGKFWENLEKTPVNLRAQIDSIQQSPEGRQALENVMLQNGIKSVNELHAMTPDQQQWIIDWTNDLAKNIKNNPKLYQQQPEQNRDTAQQQKAESPVVEPIASINRWPYSGIPQYEIKIGGQRFNREWYDRQTQEKSSQANELISKIDNSNFVDPLTKQKLKILLTELAWRNELMPNPPPNSPNAQREVGIPISDNALRKLWLNLGQINSLRIYMASKYPENGSALDPDKNKPKKVSARELLTKII